MVEKVKVTENVEEAEEAENKCDIQLQFSLPDKGHGKPPK